MQELIDFFLGAVHIYVTDPEILKYTDAACAVVCVTDILITSSVLLVVGAKCLFRTLWNDRF